MASGQGDFFAGFLVDGHVHGFCPSHKNFSPLERVFKRKGSVADMPDLDGNDNFVAHQDRGLGNPTQRARWAGNNWFF